MWRHSTSCERDNVNMTAVTQLQKLLLSVTPKCMQAQTRSLPLHNPHMVHYKGNECFLQCACGPLMWLGVTMITKLALGKEQLSRVTRSVVVCAAASLTSSFGSFGLTQFRWSFTTSTVRVCTTFRMASAATTSSTNGGGCSGVSFSTGDAKSVVDMRSDTVTHPTSEMRDAMR